MNLKEIKEMLALMNEHGLSELEIEKEGMRIKLKKAVLEQQVSHTPIIVTQEKTAVSTTPKEETTSPSGQLKTVEIKAPMVGTFYRAPSPESPPYVEVGQVVNPGEVICIIEAMKLMNEIKSEIKGKIVDILVENAEPVEFGQPIFLVEVM